MGSATNASLLIRKLLLPGSSYITNAFDSSARVTDTWLKDSAANILNRHSYVYDLGGERTKQTFKEGNYFDYTFDSLGQLKTALGKESGGSISRQHEQFKYGYDYARNLNYRTNNALVQTFGPNNLNQLTNVTRSGTLTVAGSTTSSATNVTVKTSSQTNSLTPYLDKTFASPGFSLADGNNTFTAIASDNHGRSDTNAVTINLPVSVSYFYDAKGNLTNDVRRQFTYDDENQLSSMTVTNAGGSSTLTTNIYDGLFRRRIRKEFIWQNSTWAQTAEVRYVYDGRLVIQERDGNNLPLVSYTRGADLSGSRQGAGGIGGLLARTDHATISPSHAFYHADGNGNVTALLNDKQLIVARYEHDPFGNILAKSGPLADANVYRFSSQEYHQPSGLLLYLYRAYDPNLQRWLNRDPLGEDGGINLYAFAYNNAMFYVDPYGEAASDAAHWWENKVQCLCKRLTAGSENWLFTGAVNTAGDLIGGVCEPLKLGETAGDLAGSQDVTAGQIIIGAAEEASRAASVIGGAGGLAGKACKAAKLKPKWPKTAKEMDEFLKLQGKKIPDGATTAGRDKTVWRPNKDTKITLEQHPYDTTAPDWHKAPHWHLETPGIQPHQRYLPGDDIPGY